MHSQQGTGNTRLCVGPKSLALNQACMIHGLNRPIAKVFTGSVPIGNRGSPQHAGVGWIGTESNVSQHGSKHLLGSPDISVVEHFQLPPLDTVDTARGVPPGCPTSKTEFLEGQFVGSLRLNV